MSNEKITWGVLGGFTPWEGATKKYRDSTCAEFKLLKMVESVTKGKIVHWRVDPYVEYTIDFDRYITWYRGYFRCAVK